MPTKLIVAALAAVMMATPAFAASSAANIRCDLVDTHGVRSSWEFRIVDDAITELFYTKNGVPPAHYVPGLWSSGGTIGDRVSVDLSVGR